MSHVTLDLDNLSPLPEVDSDWEKNKPYAFRGLGIVIEYFAGDTRIKVKDNGVLVKGIMPSAYGYILRTTDVHGEEIDMYLAPNPVADGSVYVIDQVIPGVGLFDEHKVMLGFRSAQEAVETYQKAFSDGSGKQRLGAITTFSGDTIYGWLTSEGYSLQPASKYEVEGVQTQILAGIATPRPNPKSLPKPVDETGGVLMDLPDLSNGPKIKTSVDDDGNINYTLFMFCALDTETWSNVVDTFCRTLDLASETDTVHIRIASPGGSVFLMGRMISAIKKTKAKVITYAQGCVASAATTIWASGHERHILPGAYFMQHMSSQLLVGKTSDIAYKSVFCVQYIERQLKPLIEIGLFTEQEVNDMIEKSSDIYISGRKAIERVGKISGIGFEEEEKEVIPSLEEESETADEEDDLPAENTDEETSTDVEEVSSEEEGDKIDD